MIHIIRRKLICCCSLVLTLSSPPHLLATPAAGKPPIDILYGAYEIIGRAPGASGSVYIGWIRLAVENGKLSVDRCVAGLHSEGEGHLTTIENDKPAVKFQYRQNGQMLEATCAYLNDFDNLPRFSCSTFGQDNLRVDVPGLEAAFPITWPVPMDYFTCG